MLIDTTLQVVEIKDKQNNPNEMEYKFYLIYVSHASIEDKFPVKSDHDYPRMYLRVQHLIEFDTFTATHGPGTYMDGNNQTTTTAINHLNEIKKSSNQIISNPISILEVAGSKRKAIDCGGPPAKQQRNIYPAYFIPELAHVVAMCDEKLPFIAMTQELLKRKIPHSGIQVEANTTSIVLKILTLPEPNSATVVATANGSDATVSKVYLRTYCSPYRIHLWKYDLLLCMYVGEHITCHR